MAEKYLGAFKKKESMLLVKKVKFGDDCLRIMQETSDVCLSDVGN